jgi:5-methylthioribose kinase
MGDSGVNSIDLKTFMQQGKATLPIAQQIGSAIGEFLGGMHTWGRGNAEVLNAVKGHEEAKSLSAWIYYGRLVSTLKGLDNGLPIPKLSDPVLEIGEGDMEVVERVVEETTKAMMDVQDSVRLSYFCTFIFKTYLLTWKSLVCDGRFLARQCHGISQSTGRFGTSIYP